MARVPVFLILALLPTGSLCDEFLSSAHCPARDTQCETESPLLFQKQLLHAQPSNLHGTALLQTQKRVDLAKDPSLLQFGSEAFPFRAGIMHQSMAVNNTHLLEFMAKRGRPLEKPSSVAELLSPLPWEQKDNRPLVSCDTQGFDTSSGANTPDNNLQTALSNYCRAGLAPLVEFYVDPKFARTYRNWTGADGWMDRAFVAFMGLRAPEGDTVAKEMDLLLQSIHHFSDVPIIATNFGKYVPSSWTPERFPRLILMHARNANSVTGMSFNFNKLTGMLFTKVKTGIALDADQWVNHGIDSLFERAAEETTEAYPYPIMPVHWMSRDPESSDMSSYPDGYTWHFKSPDAPRRTMRWGHAHPTWTHDALPFLAKWTSFVISPEKVGAPSWLTDQGWLEDEDLLNIALWAEGATKQWCKYDMPGPGDFAQYLLQPVGAMTLIGDDSKWYPKGIAYILFTAHAAKNPDESFGLLQRLWNNTDDKRKAIWFAGKWFGTAESLRNEDPSLKCIA